MISYKRIKSRFLMLTVSASLFVVIMLLVSFVSFAGAQIEPSLPLIDKITIEEVPGQELTPIESVATVSPGPGWLPLFVEDFENANWEDKWDENLDFSNPSVGLKWGTQQIVNDLDQSSMKSGWGICSDDSCGNVEPTAPSYPSGVYSVLIAGPFDLSDSKDALITMDLFYEANGGDPFIVAVSKDRSNFAPQLTVDQTVNGGQWEQKTIPLSPYAGEPQLWIAFVFQSGSSAQKLGVFVDNISVWSAPDASTPGTIYFHRCDEADCDIYRMNPNGGGVELFYGTAKRDYEGRPSPDGTKVLFSQLQSGHNVDILTIDMDGDPASVTSLASTYSRENSGWWSPDGKQIAYANGIPARPWIMDADGDNQRLLRTGGESHGVTYGADGLIYYQSYGLDSPTYDIYRLDDQGGSFELFIRTDDATEGYMVVSPDGKRLLFGRVPSTGSNGEICPSPPCFWDIWVKELDAGGKETQLTESPSHDLSAVWSPDGKYIAFSSDIDGDYEIYTLEVGEEMTGREDWTQITNNDVDDTPSFWSGIFDPVEISLQYVPVILFNYYYYPPYEDDQETEPNDQWRQANGALLANRTYLGAFAAPGDENDYYYFYLQKAGPVEVRLGDIPTGQNYDMVLRDQNLSEVGYSGELSNAGELIAENLAQGIYYIQVYNRGGNTDPGLYTMWVNYEE